MVKWCPTLDSLGIAKRLVDKFEARLQAKCKVKNRRVRPGLKRDGRAVVHRSRCIGSPSEETARPARKLEPGCQLLSQRNRQRGRVTSYHSGSLSMVTNRNSHACQRGLTLR
jgi:hypothetical protein